ncbi:MAG: hypothetical protein IKP09_08215 [Lentisphaeria bacterium]|nr:hypothetical protein [Lentisphaeria bacterium]
MIGSHCSLKRMYQKNVTLKRVKCKRFLKKKSPGLEKKQIGHILNMKKNANDAGGACLPRAAGSTMKDSYARQHKTLNRDPRL